MTSFEEILARDGVLAYKTKGSSMEPMLRQNRDLVVVRTPVSRLRKYDVALYKRGKKYVLHRVIKVEKDRYLIRGDNTFSLEIVPDDAVIGVLTSFQRKGKPRDVANRGYRLYARVWNAVYPLRLLRFRVVRSMKATAKRLGLAPFLKRLFRRKQDAQTARRGV